MDVIYYTKHRRRSKGKIFFIFLFFGTIFVLTYFGTKFLFVKPSSEDILAETDSNIPSTPSPTLTPVIEPTLAPSEELGQAVQGALVGTRGTYGVVVKNLKTGENYSFNEHIVFSSASLYKLWIMGESFEQIKNGRLKENDILSDSVSSLNERFDISSESAELKDGNIKISVKDALNKMIVISDNYTALLLTSKIRLSNVAAFLRINGFSESTVGVTGEVPETTAYDIARFFEKIYKSQITNNEYSQRMLTLLKAQRLNNKIPKLLPEGTTIAHKTGELNEFTHDGGIVFSESGDYIIVVLSKSTDPDLAEERIANISEAVFNYFENNK